MEGDDNDIHDKKTTEQLLQLIKLYAVVNLKPK